MKIFFLFFVLFLHFSSFDKVLGLLLVVLNLGQSFLWGQIVALVSGGKHSSPSQLLQMCASLLFVVIGKRKRKEKKKRREARRRRRCENAALSPASKSGSKNLKNLKKMKKNLTKSDMNAKERQKKKEETQRASGAGHTRFRRRKGEKEQHFR